MKPAVGVSPLPGFADFAGRVWLNTAHQGALPLAAADAARQAIIWKTMPFELTQARFEEVPGRLRTALGMLVNVPAQDIILANSTSIWSEFSLPLPTRGPKAMRYLSCMAISLQTFCRGCFLSDAMESRWFASVREVGSSNRMNSKLPSPRGRVCFVPPGFTLFRASPSTSWPSALSVVPRACISSSMARRRSALARSIFRPPRLTPSFQPASSGCAVHMGRDLPGSIRNFVAGSAQPKPTGSRCKQRRILKRR